MENVDSAETMSSTNKTAPQLSSSSASVPSLSTQPLTGHHDHLHRVVVSPCAACKILRRRCVDKCVLAPYFPPDDPLKFTTAHRVFGASNIIKFLQELPEDQRADAVSSMVYEANARLRDPVYGCAGAISQLQKEVNELQAQLARAHAEVATIQCQQANLAALLYTEMAQSPQELLTLPQDYGSYLNADMIQGYNVNDLSNLGSLWEPSYVDMI